LNIWREVDIIDDIKLLNNIKEFAPDEVYHLAARTDLDSTDVNDYSANTVGVKNLISACNAVDSIKRVIFASSRLVCRIGYVPKSDDDFCPTTAYGESKVIGENFIRQAPVKNFEWVIVRPTSIWGPWFGIPYRLFYDHIKKRTYFHPRGMSIKKSFGYVGNSVFQLHKIMGAKSEDINCKMFYLCDYELIEVGAFSKKVANTFGVGFPYNIPFGLLWWHLRLATCF
jgi:nucleoside-diphosphate-sugar epimerase